MSVVIVSRISIASDIKPNVGTKLIYVGFSSDGFNLGGSSFAQALNLLGNETPDTVESNYFKQAFDSLQGLIKDSLILSGHDVSSGGLITTLLEMCFPVPNVGLKVDLGGLHKDLLKVLFSESPAVVIQVSNSDRVISRLQDAGIRALEIGEVNF